MAITKGPINDPTIWAGQLYTYEMKYGTHPQAIVYSATVVSNLITVQINWANPLEYPFYGEFHIPAYDQVLGLYHFTQDFP